MADEDNANSSASSATAAAATAICTTEPSYAVLKELLAIERGISEELNVKLAIAQARNNELEKQLETLYPGGAAAAAADYAAAVAAAAGVLPMEVFQCIASFLPHYKRLYLSERCRNARDGVEAHCKAALEEIIKKHPDGKAFRWGKSFEQRLRGLFPGKEIVPHRCLFWAAMRTHLYGFPKADWPFEAFPRSCDTAGYDLHVAPVLLPSEKRIAFAVRPGRERPAMIRIWDLPTATDEEEEMMARVPKLTHVKSLTHSENDAIQHLFSVDGRLVSCSRYLIRVWSETATGDWTNNHSFELPRGGGPDPSQVQWTPMHHEIFYADHLVRLYNVRNGNVRKGSTKLCCYCRGNDISACNGKWLLVWNTTLRSARAYNLEQDTVTEDQDRIFPGQLLQIEQSSDCPTTFCALIRNGHNGSQEVCVLDLDNDTGHLSVRSFTFSLQEPPYSLRIAAVFQSTVVVFAGNECAMYNFETGERVRSWKSPDERLRFQHALVSRNRNELLISYEDFTNVMAFSLEEPRVGTNRVERSESG